MMVPNDNLLISHQPSFVLTHLLLTNGKTEVMQQELLSRYIKNT